MITNETLLTDLGGEYTLSIRSLNALLHYDIITVGQLMDFTPDPRMKKMGGKAHKEIEKIKRYLRSELLEEGGEK